MHNYAENGFYRWCRIWNLGFAREVMLAMPPWWAEETVIRMIRILAWFPAFPLDLSWFPGWNRDLDSTFENENSSVGLPIRALDSPNPPWKNTQII